MVAVKIKRPEQIYPIVEVLWDDATELKGWKEEHEEEEHHTCAILSVGFLVSNTKHHIVIAQDLSYDRMRNGRSQIPVAWIRQIKVLKRKDGSPHKAGRN